VVVACSGLSSVRGGGSLPARAQAHAHAHAHARCRTADFLRGLSLAVALASGGRTGSAIGGTSCTTAAAAANDRSAMVAEAAGCFFCAAASLLSGTHNVPALLRHLTSTSIRRAYVRL
jgi:hypothetical protein